MAVANAREDEDVASHLTDPITFHNVNKLSSASCVEDEEKPDVARMIAEGWIFSEPQDGLEVECTNSEEGVVFEFVE